MLTTLDVPAVIDPKVRYLLKIAIFAQLWGSLLEYCHNMIMFGIKTRMVSLPGGKKMWRI